MGVVVCTSVEGCGSVSVYDCGGVSVRVGVYEWEVCVRVWGVGVCVGVCTSVGCGSVRGV